MLISEYLSKREMISAASAALFALAPMTTHGATADKPDPEAWLTEAEAAYARVARYTAVFYKQQRVAGKLHAEQTILLKFRKPSSLYMKWLSPPHAGSELLYVAGWNENRVRAHSGGILRFITRNLDPGHPRLMADNLRPVTSTGIGYLLETVATNMRKASKAGELEFAAREDETVYGRNTRVLHVVFPKARAKAYDACRFVINQDVESKILLRIRAYDRDDQLVENYGYENLDLDAPLSDADFEPSNPAYRF